ncbi:hypothetical protein, partial, partial [Absidia glauca]
MNPTTPTPTTPTPTTRFCSGCKVEKNVASFRGSTRLYKTCDLCRFRQTPQPPPATMITLSEIANEFLEAHQVGDDGIWLSADIEMDERMQDLNDNDVRDLILEELRQIDGYEYLWKYTGAPSLSFRVAFEAICSQDRQGCRHIAESRLTRRYVRTDEYDCHGKVHGFINRQHNWIRLEVFHHISHPTPATNESTRMTTVPVTDEIKAFIAERINLHGPNCVGLYEQIVQVYGFVVNRGQVLNAWRAVFETMYRRSDDQLQSSRILVRELRESMHCEE